MIQRKHFKSDENTGLMMENEKKKYCKDAKTTIIVSMDKSLALRNVLNENFGGLKHCRTKKNDTSK